MLRFSRDEEDLCELNKQLPFFPQLYIFFLVADKIVPPAFFPLLAVLVSVSSPSCRFEGGEQLKKFSCNMDYYIILL